MTSPNRLLEKPDYLQMARLTTNKDHEDLAKRGDRTLSTFISKGSYYFATYSGVNPNTYKEIEYGE
jgi:hypothetical protein